MFKCKSLSGLILFGLLTAVCLTGCRGETDNISKALSALENGNTDDARASLDEAVKKEEDEKLLERAEGIYDMTQGNYEGAIDHFNKAISLSNGYVKEEDIDISYYLMAAKEKTGDRQGAIETISAILGMRPKDYMGYFIRGRLNIESDLYDDGIRDFNRAVDNAPEGPDMYLRIYEYLNSNGYDEAAQNYLSQASSLDYKLTDYQKGRIAYYHGDYEAARDYLEKARLQDDGDVILYLGMTYEALGSASFAESLYKTYIEAHPDDVAVLNRLGICRMAINDFEGARHAFEDALDVKGGGMRQDLEFNLIVALEKCGEFDEARAKMDEYAKHYSLTEAEEKEKKFLSTR